MGIMLAGVEYKNLNTGIIVPSKLETKSISNEVINVPKIPGIPIDDSAPEILKLDTEYIISRNKYQFKGEENRPLFSHILLDDNGNNIFNPTVVAPPVSNTINIPNPGASDWINDILPSEWIKEIVPTFSQDYLNSLNIIQQAQQDQKYGSYTKALGEFMQKLDNVFKQDNLIYSLRRKANSNTPPHFWMMIENKGDKNLIEALFSGDLAITEVMGDWLGYATHMDNSNFYGAIPTGYVYTMDYGKMRWEEMDWMKIDPFLANNGFVKIGNNPIIRPDLILKRTNKVDPMSRSYAKQRSISDINGLQEPKNALNIVKYLGNHFDERMPNRTIHFLMESGSDFLKNMFDAVIIFRGMGTYVERLFELKDIFNLRKINDELSYKSDIKFDHLINGTNESVLMIRTSGIEVPQIENETFNSKWLNMNINKVRSKIKYERKSNLKMLLDEPLYVRALLNGLSGTSRIPMNGIPSEDFTHRPKNFFGNLNTIHTNNIYRIDILIKHQALLNYPYLDEMKKTWRIALKNDPELIGLAENNPEEYPIWWFQDVKFLGEGNDLQFNRDDNTIIEITFPFIFSRCIKMDRSTKITIKNVFNNVKGDGTYDKSYIDDLTRYQGNQEWRKYYGFFQN